MRIRRNASTFLRSYLTRKLREYGRNEDGSYIVFGLFLFVGLWIVTGLSIDLMQYEYSRVRLQGTVDRAVLAATDLDQPLDAQGVIDDYFEKAGLGNVPRQTDIQQEWVNTDDADPSNDELVARNIRMIAGTPIPTSFMRMLGINSLPLSIGAGAENSVNFVEVSLVLDISGSMRFYTSNATINGEFIPRDRRINILRRATKDFVDIVLAGSARDNTSINIVPYAGHVNVGPFLYQRWNPAAPATHSSSYCVDLAASDFDGMSVPANNRGQVPHFMKWTIFPGLMGWGWCPGNDTQILIGQNDPTVIKNYVDSIRMYDGTNTQAGTKYGLMLLNPTSSVKSIFADLANANVIPAAFADRPVDFGQRGSQKYLIVMTDGMITDQFRPNRTGLRNTNGPQVGVDDETLSVRMPVTLTPEQAAADSNNDGTPDVASIYVDGVYYRLDNESAIRTTNTTIQDFDTLPDKVDHDMWNAAVELDNQRSDGGSRNVRSQSNNVSDFLKQCTLAKNNGIQVYAIAFEAGSDVFANMRSCASAPSMAFDARGKSLEDIFAAIARSITELRLTQ